jgi:hypothetical protein
MFFRKDLFFADALAFLEVERVLTIAQKQVIFFVISTLHGPKSTQSKIYKIQTYPDTAF